MKLGTVIPTAGRSSMPDAVASALRAGFDEVIVVNDGCDLPGNLSWISWPQVKYCKLGRNYGRLNGITYYGQIALAVGMYMSESQFTASMGDDDEYTPDAAAVIKEKIAAQPEIDIWVPGLQYNTGLVQCMCVGDLRIGNVSHPVYRPEIFSFVPMYHIANSNFLIQDYTHIQQCVNMGYKVGWLDRVCVNIRPKLPGLNGRGAN